MTTPIVVRTFKNTASSIDSDRELLFWFTPSELSDAMRKTIVSSFGHMLNSDTERIALTLGQLKQMCVDTQNAAPFTKAIIKDRLLGISYGIPAMHTSECSICTRGGAVALNMYTRKTLIPYVPKVNKGYRSTQGGDYMYLHFKRLDKKDYPVTFVSANEARSVPFTANGVYYPYVLLSNVPPLVRAVPLKATTRTTKLNDVAEIPINAMAEYDVTATFTVGAPTGTTNVLRPYLLLGRIGTLQTVCRRPAPMDDPKYELANSEQDRYTYTVFFDRGNSRTDAASTAKLRINAAMPVGSPMVLDAGAAKENADVRMDIGHKRPADEKDKEDDKKKKHKVVSSS